MVTYQWSIFRADLDPIKGSEQSGTRPVLVISAEEVNQALPVITILSVTSLKPGRTVYPTEVLVSGHDSGLPKDSIIMAHQIRAISKNRIGEKLGEISQEILKNRIRHAVRTYLDI